MKAGFSLKPFLPRSLFGRSLLILITPVLLIQVVTSVVFFDRHWSRMTSRLAFAVAGEISVLSQAIEDGYTQDPAGVLKMLSYAGRDLSLHAGFDEGVQLLDVPKVRAKSFWGQFVAERLEQELAGTVKRPFNVHMDFADKQIDVAVQLSNGVLHVNLPQRRLFSSSGYIFLLWVLGTSFILLVVAVVFMRNQVRPIRKLAMAAERFGKGGDIGAFKPEGAREVRRAAEEFIKMHQRIRRQMEQRTTMLAGVSHDLRTPLTRMKLQLEMFQNTPDIQAMKDDVQDMERMIKGYIDFVRGEGDEAKERVLLNDLIGRVIATAQRSGFAVEMSAAEAVSISVRPVAFERCMANLVDNAQKHAQHAWVSLRVVNNKAEIVIEDDGPGVPEDQYEDVFKPFYRVDEARNPAKGGVGLGLPIVMDIVHSHGGKIALSRSEHGGLRVEISLPL